jgi:hypothetical protein
MRAADWRHGTDRGKGRHSATLCTTHATWTGLGSNPGLQGNEPKKITKKEKIFNGDELQNIQLLRLLQYKLFRKFKIRPTQGGGVVAVCMLIQLLNTGFVPKRDECCPGTRISSSSGLWVGIRFAEQGALTVTARVTLWHWQLSVTLWHWQLSAMDVCLQ